MDTPNNTERGIKTFFTKKKIILSAVIALFTIVSVVGVSFAMKARDHKHRMRDKGPLMMMLGKMTGDLNLTESQKSEVEKIRQEIKAKFEANKNTRQEDAGTLENLFRQDYLDKQSLESLRKKHEAEREEMKSFMEDELIKFHKILTPEQRNKVADKIKSKREKFKNKHDRKDDKQK